MSDQEQNKKSLIPHIAIAASILVVLALVFLWPSEQRVTEVVDIPVTAPAESKAVDKPTVGVPIEAPEQPVIATPVSPPVVEEPSAPAPEPLDISDAAVKTAVLAISTFEAIGRLIVDEDLLRRFVVYTSNLAQQNIAANHQVLTAPQATFRTYQQADAQWIDAASFKRYTPYVEALESIESYDLINLYQDYKPAIEEIYAEIGDPDDDFSQILITAIDHLLDTPEVPVPVQVYSDSVMYKFSNERLESLTAPQKQLLRTGPDNMRRLKAKLRELKGQL